MEPSPSHRGVRLPDKLTRPAVHLADAVDALGYRLRGFSRGMAIYPDARAEVPHCVKLRAVIHHSPFLRANLDAFHIKHGRGDRGQRTGGIVPYKQAHTGLVDDARAVEPEGILIQHHAMRPLGAEHIQRLPAGRAGQVLQAAGLFQVTPGLQHIGMRPELSHSRGVERYGKGTFGFPARQGKPVEGGMLLS